MSAEKKKRYSMQAAIGSITVLLLALSYLLIIHPTVAQAQCGGSCPDVCYDPQAFCATDYCQYPNGGCPDYLIQGGGYEIYPCCYYPCPLVIDVAGDGINLSAKVDGVPFKMDPRRSRLYQVAWTLPNSDDAWLFLDRNGNSVVDNLGELFGNFTDQPPPPAGQAKNGFLALAVYDQSSHGGNADGRIDANDQIYSSLRLWQDRNHNGVSESTELSTLSTLGVAGIDLTFKDSSRTDSHGNRFRYRAKLYRIHGADDGRWVWDVFPTMGRYIP
jgi:hypothetical protein